MTPDPLAAFHPLIASWFRSHVGMPTDVQSKAWPAIAGSHHVLVTAPTGSGKTLTAFLWALNQLITGIWEPGATRVVYISPLKALNNDIHKNLLAPLSALKRRFKESGLALPRIQVQTRSGDTSSAERRRMIRNPPEILITTPESLNLMLSSTGGRSILYGIRTVIIDEIHGVIDSKRGVHLITAVERLVRLSREFQRIALSATIKPLETVARFVGGYWMEGAMEDPVYTPRPVTIIRSDASKHYTLQVRYPDAAVNRPAGCSIWEPLALAFKSLIASNRSTLFFTNSRKLCEKITWLMNKDEGAPLVYAHHGSLSREIRLAVEQKLKKGELRAIVSTSSLELGIDIGLLDQVVLVQSPQSVSSAIQRIGRAGHRVGETSQGVLFPTHSQDLIEAAVLCEAIANKDIESVQPVEAPLDVLAQIIVSMTGVETRNVDALYGEIRCCAPYRNLSRNQFDAVLTMLTGRYEETGIRDLRPRVAVDAVDGTVKARRGALQVLYTSGGTIPDRGYYQIRHLDSGDRIGELDEEFVWEARMGQAFTLGTQNWKIEKITHNDVFVVPARKGGVAPPFWIAEEQNRNAHFSSLIGAFLERADTRLDDPAFREELLTRYGFEASAAGLMLDYLNRQKEVTGCGLPHRRHIVVEQVHTQPGQTPGYQIVLHTFWGGRVNRPYALALKAAWEEKFSKAPEIHAANDSISLVLPSPIASGELIALVSRDSVDRLIRSQLETSGMFGARFRENAGRALLLSKHRMNERMPLWVSRLRSQQLLEEVMAYDDFPILLETWRTCLKDLFDMASMHRLLEELENGTITWTGVQTPHPSPMAMNTAWRQINHYMYMPDTPRTGKRSSIRDDLIERVMVSGDLRPRLPAALINAFVEKRQRLSFGFSPDGPDELLEWLKERLLMTVAEWDALVCAMTRDHGLSPQEAREGINEKITLIPISTTDAPLRVAADLADLVRSRLDDGSPESLADLLKHWLRYQGPVSVETIRHTFGVDIHVAETALILLADDGELISGELLEANHTPVWCDHRNLEILLRRLRKQAIPHVEPQLLTLLPVFIARVQGLLSHRDAIDSAWHPLGSLSCYPVSAGLWETEVLPARVRGYNRSMLDRLMQEGEMCWLGLPDRRVMFCDSEEVDLTGLEVQNRPDGMAPLFRDPCGRYDFSFLHTASGKPMAEFIDMLWAAVWKGEITNDTFAAMRKGIEAQFKAPSIPDLSGRSSARRRRIGGRSGFSIWKGSLPSAGNWFLIPHDDTHEEDAVDREEQKKERVRILLDRYGILFRELLARELPAFRWSELFRILRLMELSGEILTGRFFAGVSGPQFISPSAFRMLNREIPNDRLWWINAADPASLCGIDLKPLKQSLPKRLSSTHLVYLGSRLLMVSEKFGGKLTVHVGPDFPEANPCLELLFEHLFYRDVNPLKQITIETINGVSAVESPYLDLFRNRFDTVSDPKRVTLYKKL